MRDTASSSPARREWILRSMSVLSAVCGWSLVPFPLAVRFSVCDLDGVHGLSGYCEASYARVEPWTGIVVVLVASVMQLSLSPDVRNFLQLVTGGLVGGLSLAVLSTVAGFLSMPWGIVVVMFVVSLAIAAATRRGSA